MSFIFGGNTGTSYEQMLDRRRQASALSQRIGQGGWTALGAGLAGGLLNRSANKAEADGQQEYLEGDWAAATGGTPALAQAFQQRLTGGQPQESAGFPASLIQNESGGRWDAQNNEVGSGGARGHFGRLQFGQARLQDAMNAGVIPQGMTPQAFMASPEAQQSVERWHFADIDQQAQARGLDRFMGQNVGGVDVTQDAIRSMAHLGGIGGAQRFLESGGQHNPADANGTSLRDYGQRHGGNATDSAAPQALPGGDTSAIMRAMANPWATDQQRSVLSMMLQDRISQRNAMQAQQAQAADPMRQMQIEQMRLENEALRNPVPEQTSSMRNYQFLIGQGVTPEQARAQAFGGGGVTVNNQMGANSSKFVEESDKLAADRYNAIVSEGHAASGMMGDLQTLAGLAGQINTGKGAELVTRFGPYAQMLGADISGLSEMEAFQSITDRMAPQMRPAGSGASSDTDVRMFLSSLPSLGRTPEGNAIINETMQAVQRQKMAAAEIARRAQMGTITWQEADQEIADLGNPYESFNKMRDQIGGATTAPAAAQNPSVQPGHVEGGYRFKGGNPSDPSAWEKVQ